MPNVNFALSLLPKKAIEWLEKKGITDKNYRTLTESELAKVVTIARMTDLDMLQSIKDALIKSAAAGTTYQQFKKELLQHLRTAGWLHKDDDGSKVITDPNTGEVFGPPRRLETIYRTNMQSAYCAGQYQTYMNNIDNRLYWQYSAVNDSRTRPAHSALSGLVYRYDDPFWATFYPPNGYNCRCSVIAVSQRDVDRRGLIVGESGDHNLIETDKVYNKKGDTYKTVAYKTPTGKLITTDKGFSYNAGRMNYRPDLDLYDLGLAQQFAKSDMTGKEFKAALKQLQSEVKQIKNRDDIKDKASSDKKITIRNTLSKQLKFAAGLLNTDDQKRMSMDRGTVWLSDDTLVKQISSREGQDYDAYYDVLPEVINEPNYIFKDSQNAYSLIKMIDNSMLLAVIKYVEIAKEIYVQSYRRIGIDELNKLLKKSEIIKSQKKITRQVCRYLAHARCRGRQFHRFSSVWLLGQNNTWQI